MSLSAIGMPCSGPRLRPWLISMSACLAAMRARSAVSVTKLAILRSTASMRARKASVSSREVRSPLAIRRPASAMLSVVSSADVGLLMGLLVGAEHVRRLGGPGPMGWDALHQFEQSDIAL